MKQRRRIEKISWHIIASVAFANALSEARAEARAEFAFAAEQEIDVQKFFQSDCFLCHFLLRQKKVEEEYVAP